MPRIASVPTIGDLPALAWSEREHALYLADHRIDERVVGLVDGDHVRDLHHPSLECLD
jgi:hypothetical protein